MRGGTGCLAPGSRRIELDLTDEEKQAFAHSAGVVRKTCNEVDEMLKNL